MLLRTKRHVRALKEAKQARAHTHCLLQRKDEPGHSKKLSKLETLTFCQAQKEGQIKTLKETK
jgi:hypothetical protein